MHTCVCMHACACMRVHPFSDLFGKKWSPFGLLFENLLSPKKLGTLHVHACACACMRVSVCVQASACARACMCDCVRAHVCVIVCARVYACLCWCVRVLVRASVCWCARPCVDACVRVLMRACMSIFHLLDCSFLVPFYLNCPGNVGGRGVNVGRYSSSRMIFLKFFHIDVYTILN